MFEESTDVECGKCYALVLDKEKGLQEYITKLVEMLYKIDVRLKPTTIVMAEDSKDRGIVKKCL